MGENWPDSSVQVTHPNHTALRAQGVSTTGSSQAINTIGAVTIPIASEAPAPLTPATAAHLLSVAVWIFFSFKIYLFLLQSQMYREEERQIGRSSLQWLIPQAA